MIAKCRYLLKAAVLVVSTAAVLFMAGCGKPPEIETPASGRGGYSVVDATKTRLDFEHKPQRIVSLGLSADEVLLDMVEPDRIAALTYLADDAGISPAADKAVWRYTEMGIFAGAIDYFQRGGACMWPLLLCSLAAIAIGVERYLYYKKALSSTDFVMEFCRLMNDFNIVGAREFAGMNKGDAAELATETLDINEDLGKRLESIVYSKADRAIDGMEQNLDYLSVVIGLAPMLGLLGTITGMISSFNALNERAQNPMAVTAGIGEALITTVFGLCIAIMGMCIHAYLSSKVKTASLNIYEVANVLIDIVQAKNGGSKN